MYRYSNQFFLGDICESREGEDFDSVYDPSRVYADIFSGVKHEYKMGYCVFNNTGYLSGSFNSGYIIQNSTGELDIISCSGYESKIQNSGNEFVYFDGDSAQSGYISGYLNLFNFTGVLEIDSSYSIYNFTNTGDVYGFGLGQVTDSITTTSSLGDSWSALSGITSGVFRGTGYFYLSGSGSFCISGSGSRYGFVNGHSNGRGVCSHYFSGDGECSSIATGYSFINRSGIWDAKVSGYQSGYCVSDKTNFEDQGCGDFAPLRSNCAVKGNLNVKITYPVNNQVFKIPFAQNPLLGSTSISDASNKFPAVGSTIIGTGINFTGTILPGDDGNDPTDGDVDGDGDDDEVIDHCPFSDAIYPTCAKGNDGKVTYNLQNDNYLACGIKPPYSGTVTQRETYESEETVIFQGVGGSKYPFPTNLSFDNLEAGIYTLHLSGESGSLDLNAHIWATGNTIVSTEIIKKPSSCSSSDGIIRFKWNGYLDYALEDTIFAGYSTTGFIATGLPHGRYKSIFRQNKWCNTFDSFYLESDNEPDISIITTGTSCGGAGNDGQAGIYINGVNTPYSCKWIYPSEVFGDTDLIKTNLSTGLYSIDITDSVGCVFNRELQIGVNSKNLGIYTKFLDDSEDGLVCCQMDKESAYITPPLVYAFGYGGSPPYTYSWSQDDHEFHDGQFVIGYPGKYNATVTDSVGCTYTSEPRIISATNRCLKIRWSSQDAFGKQYQEKVVVVNEKDLPLEIPFKYTVPGKYIIKLSISDGYGRSGIDCVNIFVKGFVVVDPPPQDPDNEDPDDNGNDGDNKPPINPDPETPDGDSFGDTHDDGSGNGGGGIIDIEDPQPPDVFPPPIPPRPDPNGDDPDGGGDGGGGGGGGDGETKVCCGLLSAGTNDLVCRTHCFADTSFCKDRPAARYQTAAKCADCANLWQPQGGACCTCRFIEGATPDLNYEECTCTDVISCDPDSACAKLVLAAGGEQNGYYTHGFKLGGSCDISSPDYTCPAGICCVGATPYGLVGEVGENGNLCGDTCFGRMTPSKCFAERGYIKSYTALTCAEAGVVEWDGKQYCKFNPATCCIKASPVDSNTSCSCYCSESSTCKDCEEQLAALIASDPDSLCNYSGGASPYVDLLQSKTCAEMQCACSPAGSHAVGGPL